MIKRVDPKDCGCTDCIIGHSRPVNFLNDEEKHAVAAGLVQDASGLSEKDWDAYL